MSNTAVGLGVTFLAWRVAGVGDVAANAAGYAVGFAWSYMLNRRWTFRATNSVRQSSLRFVLVCGAAYLANLAVLMAARRSLGDASFLPQAAGMVTYTVLAYLGSRFYAFKSSPGAPLS